MSLERKTVGGFEVSRRDSEGVKEGFELWEAHRATDGKSAELLTVAAEPSGAPERRKVDAFLEAAEAWHRAKHPALLECYGKGILDDGRPYILSERRPEDSLDEFCATGGPMNLEAVRDLLLPVMEAAGELHSKGGFHGDISPEAVFITSDAEARPKLGGFGPVHWRGGSSGLGGLSRASSGEAGEGTDPAEPYQSPERRRGGGSLGAWADVYSLAAMTHRAITGEAPKPPSGFSSLSFGSDEGSSSGGIQVPQPIESLLDKAMSEIYMSRPADGRALAAAMKDAFKKVGVTPGVSSEAKTAMPASAATTGGASVGSDSAADEVSFGTTGTTGSSDISRTSSPSSPSGPSGPSGPRAPAARPVSYGSSPSPSPSSSPSRTYSPTSSSSGGSGIGKVILVPMILSILGVGGAMYFVMSDSAESPSQVEEVVHQPTSPNEPRPAISPRDVVVVQNDSLGRTKRLEFKNKLHKELQKERKGSQGRVVVIPGHRGEGRKGGVQVVAPADTRAGKGGAPKEVIKKVLFRQGSAFQGCVKRHGGSGVVKVQVVVVGKTGKPKRVRVRGGLRRKARKCIQEHIQRLRFPSFEKRQVRLDLQMQF